MFEHHPYQFLLTELPPFGHYFSLPKLNDERYETLPYSIRLLLENAVRSCDAFHVTKEDVESLLSYATSSTKQVEIPVKPSRVLLQDFTGVPALVDLAAMRNGIDHLGGDPECINPSVPVNLVVDHSIQVDYSKVPNALQKNQQLEFHRNRERFTFLKWASVFFKNFSIVPPGSGIVHQVNLEYLSRVVFCDNGLLYPDSVVGTDSHTTMIDGLGIIGWGVGGIEAEAVMLGEPISMLLPEVVGFELVNKLPLGSTSTDLVLTLTEIIRNSKVVGKFLEFYGEGCKTLTLEDRSTIANMSPEYGATMGFFPIDDQTLHYLKQTGRADKNIAMIEGYVKAQKFFRFYDDTDNKIQYSGGVLYLDLATVQPCCSGPKRPHDKVLLSEMPDDFKTCLTNKIGFKGFNLSLEHSLRQFPFSYNDNTYQLHHGSIFIAAITSCTNTSNPSVMLGAALLAKNAVNAGLSVPPYIKTSLSPGSGVVEQYLRDSELLPYLEALGFYITGFGCQTCIGNSGQLETQVAEIITEKDIVGVAVLSGNRNFEGRIHPLTRANYLMSPMLVVAFAVAGTVTKNLIHDSLGISSKTNNPVYLKDIWPSNELIQITTRRYVTPNLFKECYTKIELDVPDQWKALKVPTSNLFPWNELSTYIRNPPFFKNITPVIPMLKDIENAYCLLVLGDCVTTDHISPAGAICKNSAAGVYLDSQGIQPVEYNSYGARRGNDQVMCRGTFANPRLNNALASKTGPYTLHIPSNKELFIYDAAQMYIESGHSTIVIAGREYGTGSSRDWAAKGPYLLGIRAIIAESYERIHRSNLIGMGILPLVFMGNDKRETLGLNGKERFTIPLQNATTSVNSVLTVYVTRPSNETFSFNVQTRCDTKVELEWFKNNGLLPYVLRQSFKSSQQCSV